MTDRLPPGPGHLVRGLSLPRRIGYTVAGLGGLLGSGCISLLWATEPTSLPARTQAAFAAMIIVGMTWAGVAAWTLGRRPLFAIDRVVAAGLALALSVLWTIWGAALAWNRGGLIALLTVAGVGLAFAVVSGTLLLRARAYRATLLDRKRRLEQEYTSARTRRAPLPVGPLALALRLRHRGPATRTVAILALVLAVALVAGLALLTR
jgi:hypothetical protein